jgi:hypothetical protein
MVTEPGINAPDYPLRPWDVITAIGEYDVDNAGMARIDDNLRLLYLYLVPHLEDGGTVPLTVYRDGRPLEVNVPVQTEPSRLLKFLGADTPSYLIYGPFVFTPVYAELAGLMADADIAQFFFDAANPIATRGTAKASFDGEELVMVPALFPHETTHGFEPVACGILESVNGVKVKNLRHLVKMLRNLRDDFVVFEWADSDTETMVFRRSEIEDATEEILELNGIRAQHSRDLGDLLAAEGAGSPRHGGR